MLLGVIAIFILGPLGGISAAYMNFSLGFFIGGQVLAGILGSAVTYGYGAPGKHGANYMQTMAASVASMSGMGVLIQAMTWLGLPPQSTWHLILFFTCIGMFGVGVGMLYTPILVDRMQLTYPSGLAVANILRALTDPRLLKRSIKQLGGGTTLGYLGGLLVAKIPAMAALGLSTSTVGAGMVVSARIALPAFLVSLLGLALTPWLRSIGWLGENDPFRKIGFILALGTILGAALVDLTLIAYEAVARLRGKAAEPAPATEGWKRTNSVRLFLWVITWGVALVVVAHRVLHQPLGFVLLVVALVFIFLLINGIANGISDWNPISSAFVIAVFLMASLGLKDAKVGLICASILLISCTVGVDMQQDRSTGWRLGTNRVIQFRYQVMGILMGAVLAVALAKAFMSAYPVLAIDQFTHPNTAGAEQWQSAMTYKLAGALQGLTHPKPFIMKALAIGIGIGLITEILRKAIRASVAYRTYVKSSRKGRATDFLVDAVFLPSPYASSFGGFVECLTTAWFALGGVITSIVAILTANRDSTAAKSADKTELPEDMNATSLIGGGLIGGDSLAALSIGLYGLLKTVL